MLCEKCGKNNATTHIRTVVNGVIMEKNLCSHCAGEEGYTGTPHMGLAGILASMLGDFAEIDTPHMKKCSLCGASFSDIAESGKVGCPECYRTFGDELIPYLKRIHGKLKHTGKIPDSTPVSAVPKEKSIEELRNELNRLVAEEKYEDAAVIRDMIKKAEEENK